MLFTFCFNSYAQQPELLQANIYQSNIQLEDYWVSEKLDGVRAIWNGKSLISRQGLPFNPPQWFTKSLPNTYLDGELWIARNQFSVVSGLVRRQENSNTNWKNIKYMIFDLPKSKQSFDNRIQQMKSIINKVNIPHLKVIRQFKLKSNRKLIHKLDEIVSLGGEGLMLHKGDSFYKSGRSNDLLKLKKHFDAEAIVLKHLPGKGKYKNMLGALLVRNMNGVIFKIGTGFTDHIRKKPPSIGSMITYKYFGLTSKGKPRFASFMRIRKAL